MTHITATIHNASTIRLDFAFDKDVNAKIKEIPGYAFVAAGAFWTVPVRRLDELVKTFGSSLEIDPAVLDAKLESDLARVRIFVDNLLAAGISLDVVDGRVTGSGGAYCADPWQREIDARAEKIVTLGLQHSHAPVRTHAREGTHAHACANVSPETLRQVGIFIAGMQNATKNELKTDHVRKQAKRRHTVKAK